MEIVFLMTREIAGMKDVSDANFWRAISQELGLVPRLSPSRQVSKHRRGQDSYFIQMGLQDTPNMLLFGQK